MNSELLDSTLLVEPALFCSKTQQAKLFYFVGASGSGKDTVLAELKKQLSADMSLHIAQRYITRPSDYGGEVHFALSEAEFKRRQAQGEFVMHWQANQCFYGISRQVSEYLQKGISVLFNGSREQIPQAVKQFKSALRVISLEVDNEVLAQRLYARGRETKENIEARLTRHRLLQAQSFQVPKKQAWQLNNNGEVEHTVKNLLAYLNREMACN